MIIEASVKMTGLSKNITKILKIIDTIFIDSGNFVVVIATKWAKDEYRTAHESGYAIDISKPIITPGLVINKVKNALGLHYIVITRENHIHIEFAPLPDLPRRGKDQVHTLDFSTQR